MRSRASPRSLAVAYFGNQESWCAIGIYTYRWIRRARGRSGSAPTAARGRPRSSARARQWIRRARGACLIHNPYIGGAGRGVGSQIVNDNPDSVTRAGRGAAQ